MPSPSHTTRSRGPAHTPVPAHVPVPARRRATRCAIAAGCAIAALVALYCAGCIFFYQRFWPNTRIGDTDVSLMSAAAATNALQRTSDALAMSVAGQGVSFTLTGANAGLKLNVEDAVAEALRRIPSWQWPYQVLREHDASDALSSSFDTTLLTATVESQLAAYNAMAADPQDAYLYFDETTGSYQVNPGSAGTKLDAASVVDTVVDALVREQDHAPLTSQNLVQQRVAPDDPTLLAERDAANALLACNVDIMMGGMAVATLGPAVVKDWLVFGGDGTVALDEGRLVAWVDALEAELDSAGTTRSYTRPDGKYVTVSGGYGYGWITDGAALERLVRDCVATGATGPRDMPLKQAAYQVNPGGQDWGGRYVDIDISEQYARFYDWDGSLIWASACITGNPNTGHSTPTGVYTANGYMARSQTLVGQTDPATGRPEYESYVDYWMPFIGNMVGLHDATWQGYWGSDAYLYNGSHGCVNLPWDAASSLWGILQVGDVVVVHY